MFLHRALIYCWYQIHIANQVRHATFHFHTVALQIRHATLTRKMAVFGEANGKWPVSLDDIFVFISRSLLDAVTGVLLSRVSVSFALARTCQNGPSCSKVK